MGTPKRKAWKLQEFVAHTDNVTCLALGPASGRVMVTGGEDKKVNMWAIGKPNAIMSLSGHTSPVECVQFNGSEELVCAGSQSGTLKIWDLEAAKIVRTLTGHKANIRSLDFHPYGEFVASGSNDTTVRLWDVRRKGCLFTYKGHTNNINHLRFSPDGRWVISAGQDGLVKLWDLNAGKLLADFILHTGPVNKVEFHPKEFLVATGSSDRTVKFWDLETFGLISSSELEATAVRTVCFHPEGICLFSGGADSLRAYGWEPSLCYEALTLGWGKVQDMAFSSNQMIGASFQATNVQVWVANMNHLEETIQKAEQEEFIGKVEVNHSVTNAESSQPKKPSPHRKSFNARPKTTSSKKKALKQDDAVDEEFAKAVDEKLNDPKTNYVDVFQAKSALRRSPTFDRKELAPFSDPSEEKQDDVPPVPEINAASKNESERKPEPVRKPSGQHLPKKTSTTSIHPVTRAPAVSEALPQNAPPRMVGPEQGLYRPPANVQPFQPPANIPDHYPPTSYAAPVSQYQQPVSEYQSPQHQHYQQPQQPVVYQPPPPQPIANGASAFPIRYPNQPQVHPATRYQQHAPAAAVKQPPVEVEDRMRQLNFQDFDKVGGSATPNNQKSNDESTSLSILDKSHSSLCQIMEARLRNLSLVSRLWTDGDIKAAVEAAGGMTDQSVFVDILNVLILKQTLWNLEICGAILPQLKELINSKYDTYVESASSALKLILKNFSQVIKSNMHAPPIAMGVDLVREERFQKCKVCYSQLQSIRQVVTDRTKIPGRIGNVCRELQLALSILD